MGNGRERFANVLRIMTGNNDRGNNALFVTRYLQGTDIKKCKELFSMVFHQEE